MDGFSQEMPVKINHYKNALLDICPGTMNANEEFPMSWTGCLRTLSYLETYEPG